MTEIDFQSYYRVESMPGVAWYLRGYVEEFVEVVIDQYMDCPGHPGEDAGFLHTAIGEVVYCPNGCEMYYETDYEKRLDNSMVRAVMVGDDREHEIDVDDLVKISDDDFCASCGQIGCGWH